MNLRGTLPHEIFQVVLVAALLRKEFMMFQRPRYRGFNVAQVEGLRDLVEGSDPHCFDGCLDGMLSADHDYSGIGPLAEHPGNKFRVTDAAHVDVTDNDAKLGVVEVIQRLFRGFGEGTLIALLQQLS
jgi:hypothetical protein